MKVKIKSSETIYQGFLTLTKALLQFEQFSGRMSRLVERLTVSRGDAVAVLLFDSERQKVVLVEQFRFPVYTVEPQTSWVLEAVAGSIENESTPQETAVREVYEETGYRIQASQLLHLGSCFPSPGIISERIYLFAADIARGKKENAGGGVETESEDLNVIEYDYKTILSTLKSQKIKDAKTIILLQWLEKSIRD